MNQKQTQDDVLELLDQGGFVHVKLTGVSFGQRQAIIQRMMCNSTPRGITLHPEKTNVYDKFAVHVENEKGEILGFLPKNKNFTVTLPNRSRPIPFGEFVVDSDGNSLQTNQIFHRDMIQYLYEGEIVKFLNFGGNNSAPIGVSIKFWKKQSVR